MILTTFISICYSPSYFSQCCSLRLLKIDIYFILFHSLLFSDTGTRGLLFPPLAEEHYSSTLLPVSGLLDVVTVSWPSH